MQSFCHWEGDTLVLNILGRPHAKKTKIGKVILHSFLFNRVSAIFAG